MVRVQIYKAILGLALLLSGCASTPQAQHYTSLEQFMLVYSAQSPDPSYSPAAYEQISKCIARSMVRDIPYEDQTTMLDAINTRHLAKADDALFVKWLGRSVAHGDTMDNVYFADGTPVRGVQRQVRNVGTSDEYLEFLDASGAVVSTTEPYVKAAKNAKEICPDLVGEYPEAFQPAETS